MANTLSQAVKKMSFREKKDGLLEGRVNYKGIQKSFYGHSKAECQNKARQYFDNLEKEKSANKDASDVLFGDYLYDFLYTFKKPSIEPSSFTKLINVYNCQIKNSSLAKTKITEITSEQIQKFINEYGFGETHESPEDRQVRMDIWKEKYKKTGIVIGEDGKKYVLQSNGKKKCYMSEDGSILAGQALMVAKRMAYQAERDKIPLLLAQSGLKRIKHLIGPCFDYAVEQGVIRKNPCNSVSIPKESNIVVKTKEQFSLSDEEIIAFKKAAMIFTSAGVVRYRDAIVCVLLVATGLRIGEMLALEWSDINFETNLIHITKTVQTGLYGDEKTKTKDGTKTNDGRYLPMNNSIKEYLELLRKFDAYHGIKSNLVCCTRSSTPQNPKNLGRSLSQLCKRAGISENVTPHTLRHTFGSTLIRNHIGVEIVSQLLGHANIMITYNKYIHIIKEQKAETMALLDII